MTVTHRPTTTQSGFTLTEMVIVIAIIAILAGLITPLAINVITQTRINACIDELSVIKIAIIGEPTLVQGGSRSSFGFVGDMGILPRANLGDLGLGTNNRLGDLTSRNLLTAATTLSNVVWGWRGPYISDILDPWGREYNYLTRVATNNDNRIAFIWSSGPDGLTTADPTVVDPLNNDNPIITIHQDEAFSRLTGNTLEKCGAGAAAEVYVFAPNGATVVNTALGVTTAANPIYPVPPIDVSIPIGIRRIQITKDAVNYFFTLTVNNGPITTFNFREPGTCL